MFARKTITALLTGSVVVATTVAVQAQTTPAASLTTAGTRIDNTAAVTYSVNGTSQSTNSTTASFLVDRKVNFTTVIDQTGYTQVNVGQQNAYVTFKVTNLTNDVQDFLLDPDQSVPVGVLPGTDNFDMANLTAYVDSNGNGVYDAGVDTATYIDELRPDQSATVFLVGNVPNISSASLALVSLHAIVAAGGAAGVKGSALIPTDLNIINGDNTVDVVFADDDSDGIYPGDLARNGQGRAYGGFEVGSHNVALSVAKSARVLSDGVNLVNPKAIPGAVVEYCLITTNATLLTPADTVNLTDALPANTTYVPGSIAMGVPGVPGVACVLAGSVEDDDADDASEIDGLTASYDASNKIVRAQIQRVLGGTSVATSFRVKIN